MDDWPVRKPPLTTVTIREATPEERKLILAALPAPSVPIPLPWHLPARLVRSLCGVPE